MFKKCLIFSLVLLLVPACCKNRSRFGRSQPAYGTPVETVVPMEGAQTVPASAEDVEAFMLDEDENPFTTKAAVKAQNGEEVALENVESSTGDLYADSSKHGLKTIYYNFDQHGVRADQKAVLEHDVEVAQNLVNKGYDLTVEGHACNSAGNKDYNIMLSEKRAEGIKKFFVENGIDEHNIRTVGWGYERPVVPFGTTEQQAPNRRVEVYAYPHDKNAPKA